MPLDEQQLRERIRARVAELAREIGNDASRLGDDDSIPQSGLLDSAGILGLIVWCEGEFDVALDLESISVDNFGTINRMCQHLRSLKPDA